MYFIYCLLFNIDTYMHMGHQCKVNELEYGDLLVEAGLVVNGNTEIHRYSYVTRYVHITNAHRYVQGHLKTTTGNEVCGKMCCCIALLRHPTNI